MHNYQRDGHMNLGQESSPYYYPNSYDGPAPDKKFTPPSIDVQGMAARHEYPLGEIDFEQARDLYGRVMSDYDRSNLIKNITGHLGNAQKRIQLRQTALFYKTHPDYGTRIAQGLGLDIEEVKKRAAMTQGERVIATEK